MIPISSMLKNSYLKYVIQITLSVIIISVLIYFLDIQQVLSLLGSFSLRVLVYLFLLIIPSLLVRSFRWKMLFNNKTHRVSFRDSTAILLVGQALNMILPASSGDVLKSYFGYMWTGVKERMLSISVTEKIIALGSVGLLGFPLAYLQGHYLLLFLSAALAILSIAFVLMPAFIQHSRLLNKFLAFLTQCTKNKISFELLLAEAKPHRQKYFFAFVLSVIGWLFTYIQLFLCFYGNDSSVPLTHVLLMAPLLTVIRLCPFTLSGYGSDEAAMCLLFAGGGVSREQILAAALMYRFVTMILPGLVGWLVVISYKVGKNKNKRVLQEQ